MKQTAGGRVWICSLAKSEKSHQACQNIHYKGFVFCFQVLPKYLTHAQANKKSNFSVWLIEIKSSVNIWNKISICISKPQIIAKWEKNEVCRPKCYWLWIGRSRVWFATHVKPELKLPICVIHRYKAGRYYYHYYYFTTTSLQLIKRRRRGRRLNLCSARK